MKPINTTSPQRGPQENRASKRIEHVLPGASMELRLLRMSPSRGAEGRRQPELGLRRFTFGDAATVLMSEVRTPQQAFDMGASLVAHLLEACVQARGHSKRRLQGLAAARAGLVQGLDGMKDAFPPGQDCEVACDFTPEAYIALMAVLADALREAARAAQGADRAMLERLHILWAEALSHASQATRIPLLASVQMEGRADG